MEILSRGTNGTLHQYVTRSEDDSGQLIPIQVKVTDIGNPHAPFIVGDLRHGHEHLLRCWSFHKIHLI